MLPGDLFSLVLRVLFKLRRGGSLPMWRSCRSCCGRNELQAMPAVLVTFRREISA
jgi:hypothetical protein